MVYFKDHQFQNCEVLFWSFWKSKSRSHGLTFCTDFSGTNFLSRFVSIRDWANSHQKATWFTQYSTSFPRLTSTTMSSEPFERVSRWGAILFLWGCFTVGSHHGWSSLREGTCYILCLPALVGNWENTVLQITINKLPPSLDFFVGLNLIVWT